MDGLKNLKQHLQNQIKEAYRIDSDWVYILKVEAKKCLELAEAEDVILEMLKDQPQIVHCKDCKWLHTDNCFCKSKFDVKADWFCSAGERLD